MVIKRVGKKWELFSKDGNKSLGEYDDFSDALKRERQVNYFKNIKKTNKEAPAPPFIKKKKPI